MGAGGQNQDLTTDSSRTTRSGLADMTLWVSRAFFPQAPEGMFYEIVGSAKLATGDEDKNLSNGENDYAIELNSSYKIGPWTPGLSIGYQLTGDPPEQDLNNILFVSAGASYKLSKDSSIAMKLHYAQSVSDSAEDPADIALKYTQLINQYIDLGANLTIGLSESSADFGAGLSMTAYY
jgi:hypothetical protein